MVSWFWGETTELCKAKFRADTVGNAYGHGCRKSQENERARGTFICLYLPLWKPDSCLHTHCCKEHPLCFRAVLPPSPAWDVCAAACTGAKPQRQWHFSFTLFYSDSCHVNSHLVLVLTRVLLCYSEWLQAHTLPAVAFRSTEIIGCVSTLYRKSLLYWRLRWHLLWRQDTLPPDLPY